MIPLETIPDEQTCSRRRGRLCLSYVSELCVLKMSLMAGTSRSARKQKEHSPLANRTSYKDKSRMYVQSGRCGEKMGREAYNCCESARDVTVTEPDGPEIRDVRGCVYCIAYVPGDRRYHVGR